MSLRLDTGSKPWPPLFNSFVNDTLLQLCPHNDEALLQLIDVPYCCLVDAFHEEQFRAPELQDGDGDHP